MSDAMTPERLDEIRERANLQRGLDGDDADDLLAHIDHLTAEVERLRVGIEALHRPVLPVFSWRDGLRFDEPCPECNGKAGVHPCGCWSDEDTEFVCFECSRPSSGHLRRDIPWPCETAALLNTPTEGETP